MDVSTLEADFAITLRPREAKDLAELERGYYYWTGWRRRHWPADIVRPGLRLYGYDTGSRCLCVLLEVTRGGAFDYSTLEEFARKVKKLTGWEPLRNDRHWGRLPIAQPSKQCTGIALRWKVIKAVNLPWDHRFPQLGWERLLKAIKTAQLDTIDADVASDLQAMDCEEHGYEGRQEKRFTNHYERDPRLRAAAIRIHGTRCAVCSFSFGDTYGERGSGFIEVHHLRPVHSLQEEEAVDPRSDMVAVCSNCHRMIHRRTNDVLSPEALSQILGRATGRQ